MVMPKGDTTAAEPTSTRSGVFPNRVRLIREALKRRNLKWTQQFLAQRAGLSLYTILRVEQGKHPSNERTKEAIANALGYPVDEVFPSWPNNVREFRQALGWSQERLAKEAGLSLATLVAVEAHKGRPIKATKKALAAALSRPIDEVFPEEREEAG